jgi:glutamate-1-semialdehyde 2,1-aminomutase
MNSDNSVSSGCNIFTQPDSESAKWHRFASHYIPYGTPKANLFMQPHPLYLKGGSGCWAVDLDDVRRLDFINSFTALIHGHAFTPVVTAVSDQLTKGTNFSFSTREEADLAKLIADRVAGVEKIRFGNSGTEAVMMAIKAARAFTGRDRIAKFEGAYHGYYDDVQVSFNSGPSNWGPLEGPLSTPSSGGIPSHRVQETLVLPWNNRDVVEQLITKHKDELAAVIVDPLSNRMGFIAPEAGFLDHVREVTKTYGILLIYDEVISFRVDYGGAQNLFGGDPDLTAFGKIIGGGFPVGATGGSAEVMEVFDPRTSGPSILSGGTFSANPVSMCAGLASMKALDEETFIQLQEKSDVLRKRLNDLLQRSPFPGQVTGLGSLFRFVMTDTPLHDYRDIITPEIKELGYRFFNAMLDNGVMINSNGLACLSTPMGEEELQFIESACDRALADMKRDS